MASRQQMTGMLGVYLVAAELSRRELIVSPTSRSAAGADLLVTDQDCAKAWSVQVKTNRKKAAFWLVGERAQTLISPSHLYVFVNILGEQRPEFLVIASRDVASRIKPSVSKTGLIWYEFHRAAWPNPGEGWELFAPAAASVDAGISA